MRFDYWFKIFVTVSFLVCCPMLLSSKAFAVNEGNVSVESYTDLQAWYNEYGSQTTDQVAQYFYNTFVDGSTSDILLVYYNSWNYFYSGTVTETSNGYEIDISNYDTCQKWTRFDGTRSVNPNDIYTAVYDGTAVFSLVAEPIDFTNLIYDPSIPTPIFSVVYNDDSSTMPRFNADIELQNASSDLYVYVTMDNATPISYGIAYDGSMQQKMYHKFATRELVSMESLKVSNTLSGQVLSGLASSGWRADISTIDDEDIEVYPISDGAWNFESSPLFQTNKAYLLTLRKVALFYGNSNTISVQYFRIENGRVYIGEIKSWNNLNGGVFTVTVPKYYIPDNPANGFEVITLTRPMETANPLTTIPDNQYGYRTGLDININVGSNVPNYPDYPTIATYNLDNMLVSTMNQGESIGGFLKGIAGFAGAALSFIPDYVWQLVAFGLGLSIVVMFLKIL